MAIPQLIKDLLESGVHFGHLSKHWNPKMKKFIFGKKKNIYIIDLEKTAQKLEEAKDIIKQVVLDGKHVLFVSTKRQLRELIKEEASSCQMSYVVERWVGGLLTNFSTIRSRVVKFLELSEKKEKGEFESMPGKERVRLNRELGKMARNYKGVVSLEQLPGCVYVVDPKKEVACVREAKRLSIPIVGLIDTDANPEVIDYPIPGNDDAIKSVRFITSCISSAINEAAKSVKPAEKQKVQETEKSSEVS